MNSGATLIDLMGVTQIILKLVANIILYILMDLDIQFMKITVAKINPKAVDIFNIIIYLTTKDNAHLEILRN